MKRVLKNEVKIGNKVIGGNNKILIQSMSTILPSNTNKCIKQIKMLEDAGCDIIRVAIKTKEDAYAIKKLKEKISIPIVADIHFDYELGILSIENGVDKIRFNPGNIGKNENLKKLVDKCIEKNIPVRIGVNSGSLEKKYLKMDIPQYEKAVRSLSHYVRLCEKYGLTNLVLSVKLTNVLDTIKAYELINKKFKYPLHIGLTESGVGSTALIKSSVALGTLINEGIGDTIRVSLTGDPINEVYAAKDILRAFELIDSPNFISCPTCGRTEVNLEKYALEVKDYLKNVNKNINVAVMGCLVNGPGEARDADLGVAFLKTVGVLFKKGVTVFRGTPSEVIEKLKEEIDNY